MDDGRPTGPIRRVLVVEDEYLLAEELCRDLEAAGLEVAGPVARLDAAMALLEAPSGVDAAVLDIRLGSDLVYPLVHALRQRGLPVVFATGVDDWALPPEMADVPRVEKPVNLAAVLRALGLRAAVRR